MGIDYLRYNYKIKLSMLIGVITWSSLATFMLTSRNAIGINSIPIFEFLTYVSGLVSVFLVYRVSNISYRLITLINIITTMLFLVSLYYSLIFSRYENEWCYCIWNYNI